MRPILTLLIVMLFTGCTTTMNVKKVADSDFTTEGVRYYLPKPFLLVQATADGTVTVLPIFLPDKSRQYAVQTRTSLGKFKLTMNLSDEGFLNEFGWKPDNTELAKAAAEQAGALAKAQIDARQQQEKEEAEAAQKRLDAIEAAEDAVRKARAERDTILVEITEIEQSNISADKKAEKLLDARIRLARAESTLAAAEAALARLKSSSAASNGLVPEAANDPAEGGDDAVAHDGGAGSGPEIPAGMQAAFGPLLLEVVDNGNSVSLVPVAWEKVTTDAAKRSVLGQLEFATQTIKVPEGKNESSRLVAAVRQQIRPADGRLTLVLDLTMAVDAVDEPLSRLRRDGQLIPPNTFPVRGLELSNTRRAITVELDPTLVPGDYSLAVVVEFKEAGQDKRETVTVPFQVRR